MADEVATLKVLITGDAADLQSAIQKTEAELLGMGKAISSAGKLSEASQKAFDKVTASTKTYRDSVNAAKAALDKQNTAFNDASVAYKQNTKDITSNLRGLKQQKTTLESAIVSKNDEIKALENANKAINKNSSEYKNNQKAIQWVKNEQSSLMEQHTQVTENIGKQTTALKKERASRNAARLDLKQSTTAYEEMSSILEDVEKQEKALYKQNKGQAYKQLGDDLDTINKPMQTAAVAMAAGGVAAVKFAMDYETAFTGVKKTVDGTDAELNKLNKDIRQMALDIPVSATELANLAATGGQLCVGVNDIGKFTETIAAMGVATNLAGEEGASALARIINVTGDTMDNVDRVGSSIVALGNNSATTEREIADMAVRMGKFGNTVGINTANVLGYSAALSSMGIEAQAGGSALGRTWLDIEKAVSSGGAALNAYAKYSGKSASEFKEQWNTDASGAFAGLIKGLSATEDLTGALSELGIQNTLDQQAVMALANNYDMLEKSLSLASSAYEENTALTKEAQAAYATTASQIQLAKNNLVEAAMGFGEILLPEVVDATGGVKGFAESIANMSNAQKQGLITIGKWVIGLGATTKLATGAIKGIGSTMQAIGNIEEAVSAGGALAKFAPNLTKIISAAPYAAAGIAAVGTAVTVGKKAYDAWYDSQYRWSKGLSEGNEAIAESLDKVKELDGIQKQIKSLNLIIENPESSQEQVNNAKTKLEEIKTLLSEEYNLVINSDNDGLEKTVEQVKERNRNNTNTRINEQTERLTGLRSDFEEYRESYAGLDKQLSSAIEKQSLYSKISLEASEIQNKYTQGTYEYNRALADLGVKYGLVKENAVSSVDVLASNTILKINSELKNSGNDVESLTDKINNLKGSYEEYIAISTQIANWETELLNLSALEGDAEGVSRALSVMGTLIRNAGLDMHGYAIAAAEAMNGQGSLEKAWKEGGETLDNVVNDYIRASTEFGASSQKTAVGAALLKNGFKDIGSAVKEGKLDVITQQANELADSMEGLEGKNIEISAEGDISVIDEISGKVEEIQKADGVTVKINADGDVSVLDEAGNEIRFLETNEAVSLQVNAEGNIEVLNEAGEVIETIPQDVQTNVEATTDYTKGEQEPPTDEPAKVNYKLGDQDPPQNKTAVVTYRAKYVPNARGTSDFGGGLAMINDERGVSDPRELVEVDGKGYIFEGKDVVLPLPEHTKVYTASQTKAIMAGRGIPHYASGKDNEAWDNAQANWRHYTAINDVSASEALAHWNEMLEKFKNDAEVIKEIQEEIVASTKDLWNEELEAMQFALDMGWISQEEYYEKLWRYRDENFAVGSQEWRNATLDLHKWELEQQKNILDAANEASKTWMETTNYLNTWEAQGDSMLGAYVRYRERNLQAVKDGLIDEQEAYEDNNDFMESMLKGRFNSLTESMDREARVWGLSADEKLQKLSEFARELEAYYADFGALTDEQFVFKMKLEANLEDATFSAIDDRIAEWEQAASLYLRESQTLGWDWKNNGDSEASYYLRMMDKYKDFLDNGGLNAEQYNEYQTKMREAELDAYSAASQEFEDMLSEKMDEINEMQSALSDKVSALRESWTVEDRQADIEETKKQLSIYENAVTKEGREEYERLQEELKQLEREEKVFQMEQENNAVLAELEAEYKRFEESKDTAIANILADADAFNVYNMELSNTTSDIEKTLSDASSNKLTGILTALTDIHETVVNALDNLDFDININNNISASDNFDGSAFVNKLVRDLYSKLGGR